MILTDIVGIASSVILTGKIIEAMVRQKQCFIILKIAMDVELSSVKLQVRINM